MKIAIMGSGGVGGYFGARLADAGNDVTFIARGTHLQVIRDHGLRVHSPRGDLHITPAQATSDPAEVGPVNVVLFATKLYDTESAGTLCKPLVGDGTAVISLLNGVDSEEQLSRILGPRHVAGGVARISAELSEPGVITHHSDFASMEFGELDAPRSDRLERFLEATEQAHIDARLSDDIIAAIWRKFIMLASFSAITTLTRLPAGGIGRITETRALMEEAAREAADVARARGVHIDDQTLEKIIEFMHGLPGSMKSSMLMDLERGNRLELEWLSGAVCRLGAESGVATPVHRVVLAALMPFANGHG